LRTHAIQPGLKASITEQIAQGMTQPQVRQSIKWVEAQPRTDGQPGKVASSTTTIEYAWLEDDGSIATEFRINFGGGCAMGTKRYKTTDKQYKDLLEHLGGLKPGERKRVPPWED
jgi:hypothetical protein